MSAPSEDGGCNLITNDPEEPQVRYDYVGYNLDTSLWSVDCWPFTPGKTTTGRGPEIDEAYVDTIVSEMAEHTSAPGAPGRAAPIIHATLPKQYYVDIDCHVVFLPDGTRYFSSPVYGTQCGDQIR